MHDTYRIVDDTLAILAQGLGLIRRLPDAAYVARPLNQASVGSHVRHLLDFYDNFLRGMRVGMIDYDQRRRDPEVEHQRALGVDRFALVMGALELGAVDGLRDVLVRQDALLPADDPRAWSQSTLHRELQGLVSHTIHHYALIALTLRMQGIEPGDTFGLAPSTVEYRQGQGMEG